MSLLDTVDACTVYVAVTHTVNELIDETLKTTEIYTDNMSLTEAVHWFTQQKQLKRNN